MPKATWNGAVLTQSGDTIVVEGNHYFPRQALDESLFRPGSQQSQCPWKGTASYYSLAVNGEENADAAWYYPETKHAAKDFENYVAFWKGVIVEK